MPDKESQSTQEKQAWVRPQLVELESDTSDIENGVMAGNDGAGGFTTSMS